MSRYRTTNMIRRERRGQKCRRVGERGKFFADKKQFLVFLCDLLLCHSRTKNNNSKKWLKRKFFKFLYFPLRYNSFFKTASSTKARRYEKKQQLANFMPFFSIPYISPLINVPQLLVPCCFLALSLAISRGAELASFYLSFVIVRILGLNSRNSSTHSLGCWFFSLLVRVSHPVSHVFS